MDYYDLLTDAPHKSFKCVKHSLVIKKGGSLEDNRRIVRSKADILLDPISSGKMTVDSAVVEIAKQRGVAIAIRLKPFLTGSRLRRARLLVACRKLVQLCLKAGVRPLIVSDAADKFEARSPQQLIAFGTLLGLTPEQAKWSVTKRPQALLEAMK